MNSEMKVTLPPPQILNTFVPFARMHLCPDWAIQLAYNLHGSGKRVSGTDEDGCFAFSHRETNVGSLIPFGDWIVTYRYTREDGVHDVSLYIAATLAS